MKASRGFQLLLLPEIKNITRGCHQWWQWQLQNYLRLELLEGTGEGLMLLLSVAGLLWVVLLQVVCVAQVHDLHGADAT
jgi:hypothetical protein